MSRSANRNSEPLELSPLVWVALAGVALIGLLTLTRNEQQYAASGPFVITRLNQTEYQFPRLGIDIQPPEGWTHLSLTDTDHADRPVFVNGPDHAIVVLRPGNTVAWDHESVEPAPVQYGMVSVQWLQFPS